MIQLKSVKISSLPDNFFYLPFRDSTQIVKTLFLFNVGYWISVQFSAQILWKLKDKKFLERSQISSFM